MVEEAVGVGESRMWDGCVEIVLGFDTKDGCVVVGLWLECGCWMVEEMVYGMVVE